MNQVDIDVPMNPKMSRLAVYCWGTFFGAMVSVPASLTWQIVAEQGAASIATYWLFRGLGRINRYRKERQQRAC